MLKRRKREKIGYVRNHTFQLAAKLLLYRGVSFTPTIRAMEGLW